ncbi:RNA 3'-terminal phosphate cyclase (ATP) [Acinetobacter marinus]|uniref:RNA 3'-terminal phosphate cyclase n=1 Tax=Acinetobacter marinus TaxID=281375 RepID=A0A1G6NDS4_9GAMM|nr:RNA 3'-terminal phosphate cyclase [Acinetobacter marinus]SDC65851.1 RNA 3'-terminal phosphate cyclase (ATP) [Acinetobacter marinus]
MNSLIDSIITIDGAQGEGGGQILRTALSLSMITGKAFTLTNIRAGRKKPGLMRQHLVCVQSAQQISNAKVEGAMLGSQELIFQPQQVQAGEYHFQIGSAGSTTLVLQTILPALLLQNESSQISIQGGTHNPLAPSADFISMCFLPTLQKIGVEVDFQLEKVGFMPIGAGQIRASIHPWLDRKALNLCERGDVQRIESFAGCLNLDKTDINQRELDTLSKKLNIDHAHQMHMHGVSQGNALAVLVKFAAHQQLFTALGTMNRSAERVANGLASEVRQYLGTGAMVDEYLADQLLLPLALGAGGSFTASHISEHTRTQAQMIQRFMDCDIQLLEAEKPCHITVNRT